MGDQHSPAVGKRSSLLPGFPFGLLGSLPMSYLPFLLWPRLQHPPPAHCLPSRRLLHLTCPVWFRQTGTHPVLRRFLESATGMRPILLGSPHFVSNRRRAEMGQRNAIADRCLEAPVRFGSTPMFLGSGYPQTSAYDIVSPLYTCLDNYTFL